MSCYRKKLFGWSTRLPQILEQEWQHMHLTWTLPGRLRNLLFERQFEPQIMNHIAARIYQQLARKYVCKTYDHYWQAGILSTVHSCGNGLNYNPHVHSIVTRELLHTQTGELVAPKFLPYTPFRKAWRDALLRVLVRRKYISATESRQFKQRYPKGFTVHFQPIDNKANPKTLYRTAQYLASGYFHNSQIIKVDHDKMRVTFRHRKHLNVRTREKRYATVTLPIYEFMSRMLFYLPGQHQKAVRYYGIYATNKRKSRASQISSASTWAAGIENSFQANPKNCPDCNSLMQAVIFFKYQSYKLTRRLSQNYSLGPDGYYRPIRGP
ncbi:MAG: transposase [Leptospiraceae bacterium]|nr:transposase [Leptospiraceae bacterium]